MTSEKVSAASLAIKEHFSEGKVRHVEVATGAQFEVRFDNAARDILVVIEPRLFSDIADAATLKEHVALVLALSDRPPDGVLVIRGVGQR